jgi:peptide deformylase
VALRAFSWRLEGEERPSGTPRLGYVLNPVLTEISDELQEDGEEGCLSVPGLWYPRTRSAFARCEGEDLDGNPVVLEGEGILARLVQHEVGHLDGELYIDGLDRPVKKRALRDIRERL